VAGVPSNEVGVANTLKDNYTHSMLCHTVLRCNMLHHTVLAPVCTDPYCDKQLVWE